MSGGYWNRHSRTPGVKFRIDMPAIDPGYMVLIDSIREVRQAGGQDAVNAFVDEWRARGHIECSDVDADWLKRNAGEAPPC